MLDIAATKLFQRSSTTYYISSLFFPSTIREAVFTLYSFVRTADNFVDSLPQDGDGLEAFEQHFWQRVGERGSEVAASANLQGKTVGLPSAQDRAIIDAFVDLFFEHHFSADWLRAFFLSMRADLSKHTYHTMNETITYMYGSAEVIGLMLQRIFRLDPAASESARMLGRAMQFANMIRDIGVDQDLGRQYLPTETLKKFGLETLSGSEARAKPEQFERFLRSQIEQYHLWQKKAGAGYHFLPKRLRVPVMTAAQMYTWTMSEIAINPLLVYKKQLKPSRRHVVLAALKLFLATPK